MPPVVTSGEKSVAITMIRPSRPTRPPRASTPVVAATSQSTEKMSTAPSLRPTIEMTAVHEKVSSSASQRARLSNHSIRPVRPMTVRPTAAAARVQGRARLDHEYRAADEGDRDANAGGVASRPRHLRCRVGATFHRSSLVGGAGAELEPCQATA